MLGDGLSEIEFLKSLSQNWPLLSIFIGALWWFARFVAQPLTSRHIAFIDTMEARDQIRLAADVEHTHTLNDVREKVIALNDKASVIKDVVTQNSRAAIGQPHGGA